MSSPLFKKLIVALLVVTLSGCAAQMAYREGQRLIADNKVEAGLLKLKEASNADSGNAQYRMSYIKARDLAIVQYLEMAESQVSAGRNDEVPATLNKVLAIDPANERARSGLRNIEMEVRHNRQLSSVEKLIENQETDTARQILTTILVERPEHIKARTLLRTLSDDAAVVNNPEHALTQQFRKPISIQFQNTPLRQVFDVIASTSGINFIFDKDVRAEQSTSILLKNSTIELALYYLLMSNQLEQQIVDNNTVIIYPSSQGKLKEYQEMVVKSFFLSNADAKVVGNTLKTILKSRDIVVDEKLNLIILRDTREAIKLAEKLVALQDISEPEVMLEVEVLEVKTSRLLELGVNWPSTVSLSPLTTASGLGLTIADLRHFNQGNIGITKPSIAINANKIDGDTNILANPRIRVRNREKARVYIGEKLPSITTTVSPGAAGFASETVTYIDVGLTLNVEPTIYLNNEVAIKVGLEVSNLLGQITTKTGTIGYQIGTRQASTMLQLKDGENQVLAGLISNEDRSNGNKVPGVGDLPIVGRLFGSTKDDTQKTEIVLSITPRLIRNIKRPEATLSEFASGTDSSFRNRPQNNSQPLAERKSPSGIKAEIKAEVIPVAPLMKIRTKESEEQSGVKTINQAVEAIQPETSHVENVTGSLKWHGPSNVSKGDVFIVQLSVQAETPIVSLPMTLSFDPKILQVASVSEGNFLRQDGAKTSFNSKIDPAGKITLTALRNATSGVKNFDIFTSISFKALASNPQSKIHVLHVAPIDENKQALVIVPPSPFIFKVQ
ncbi:MAG: cohesin domain-containing protein [Undibacterium sp.]|uniref:cohesin domain-containing protein n=1 Tax=Undibacterium sp. TaxID=1914977 RepID=UPI00271A3A8D|nr:cohesin domain-containing protein [Undibacterium sp.]MDO8653452.1 cohesin domain-containing protein [Undibacterium sp.]